MFSWLYKSKPEPPPEPVKPAPKKKKRVAKKKPEVRGPRMLYRTSFPIHPKDEARVKDLVKEIKEEFRV